MEQHQAVHKEAKATEHLNTQWITERAAELVEHARENKLAFDLVFHDADRKFFKDFRDSLQNRGLRPRKLRPRSAN